MIMATSTFGKQFSVLPKKSKAFVREMSKKVPPTLQGDFKSKLKHEKDLKDYLQKALH